MKTEIPDEVPAEILAELIGVDPRTVRNHAAAGVITRTSRGKYPLADSIRRILAEARKSRPTNALDREQAALAAGKRRLIDLRIAEREAVLIEFSEAEAVLDEVIGTFRRALDTLPARASRDVKVRQTVKLACDEALREVSEKFDEFAKKGSK